LNESRSSVVLQLISPPSTGPRRTFQPEDAGAPDTALGGESLERALQDGARLSLQEAVAYAQRGRGERADATHGWASLSPVERQVVELASQGLSNPDIASELFISRNTVKVYLSRAYAKLGVANRTELARLATRHSQARQQR
jgi:DNA-binding NarL/FixJ family response regulator